MQCALCILLRTISVAEEAAQLGMTLMHMNTILICGTGWFCYKEFPSWPPCCTLVPKPWYIQRQPGNSIRYPHPGCPRPSLFIPLSILKCVAFLFNHVAMILHMPFCSDWKWWFFFLILFLYIPQSFKSTYGETTTCSLCRPESPWNWHENRLSILKSAEAPGGYGHIENNVRDM